jgi:D-alanyl-D-alanine carboxypeptidase
MASITKIATAIVALEHGKLNDVVKVKYDPNELVDSTAMGCQPGEWYTLEDLLYGLMLPSGNDAALAIANHIAGSKQAFVAMMNDKVRELGLTDTHFVNPHGLDEEGHYSSAYDMAMLARYGMTTNVTFRNLAAAKYWDIHGSKNYRIYNLNRFLQNYDYADGVKIGYTDEAGRTTVASATYEGHRVYVAFLNGGDIVNDVVPMFKYAYTNFQWSSACPTAQPSSLDKNR